MLLVEYQTSFIAPGKRYASSAKSSCRTASPAKSISSVKSVSSAKTVSSGKSSKRSVLSAKTVQLRLRDGSSNYQQGTRSSLAKERRAVSINTMFLQ